MYFFLKGIIDVNKIVAVTLEDIWLNEKVDKPTNPFKPKNTYGDNVNVHKVLGELLGACKMAVLTSSRVNRIKMLHPQTWKSAFKMTGKGWYRDKQKAKTIEYACKISGKNIKTDDEADAILMAYYANKELYNMKEDLRENEFKIEGYPHVFKYFDKKDFNELGDRFKIIIQKEVKEVIGQNPNGTNKWAKSVKDFKISDLKTLTREQKEIVLEAIKEAGFKSDLAEKVWQKQFIFVRGGK